MINRDSQNTTNTLLLQQDQFVNQQKEDRSTREKQLNIQYERTIQKRRIQSLDIYRGLTVFGMLLVDDCGPQCPSYLDHPYWNGLTPADLIFPAFLFIIGFAVPLSINQKHPIKIRNFIRILILFLLGMFINLTQHKFDFSDIQYLGILQRCSLCYLFVLIIHVLTKKGTLKYRIYGLLFVMIITFAYIACMLSFDKPQIGCPKQKNLTRQCNFAFYWNKTLLNYKFQPEGLVSTLTAFGTTYFGYLFCLIYRDKNDQPRKFLTEWVLISFMVGLLVYPLTFIMPINKRIYSVSFMALTILICGLSIATFMYFFDYYLSSKQKLSKVIGIIIRPFFWLGKNPLIIFFLMYEIQFLFEKYIFINQVSLWRKIQIQLFQSWISDIQISSVIFGCFITIIWTIFAGILHYKKIFIKL